MASQLDNSKLIFQGVSNLTLPKITKNFGIMQKLSYNVSRNLWRLRYDNPKLDFPIRLLHIYEYQNHTFTQLSEIIVHK